jgi:hypothetical protein
VCVLSGARIFAAISRTLVLVLPTAATASQFVRRLHYTNNLTGTQYRARQNRLVEVFGAIGTALRDNFAGTALALRCR